MSLSVRTAVPTDADAAVRVLRRSITELCVADHQGDPGTLEQWLSNKNVERFTSWVANPDTYVVVAEGDAGVCGVGMLNSRGEIQLCYVLPGCESQGVGRALLAAIESQARSWGIERLRLDSTRGACSFYERAGYRSLGEPACGFGLTRCHPYEKQLGGGA